MVANRNVTYVACNADVLKGRLRNFVGSYLNLEVQVMIFVKKTLAFSAIILIAF